jgi:hypothetical protein
MVDKVALAQVFSEYFGFPCQFLFHRLLHSHHHLSSGAGTIGQIVADVPSGLSLTPTQEIKKNYTLTSSQLSDRQRMQSTHWLQVTKVLRHVLRVARSEKLHVSRLAGQHWLNVPDCKLLLFWNLLSSELWRREIRGKFNDVSEERTASILFLLTTWLGLLFDPSRRRQCFSSERWRTSNGPHGITPLRVPYFFLLLFLVGWDWVHLVLRPLLAYCTSPRW